MNIRSAIAVALVTAWVGGHLAEAKALRFNYDDKKLQCLDRDGKVGCNRDVIGECGDLRTHDFEKDKSYYSEGGGGRDQLLMAKVLDGALLNGQNLRNFNFMGTALNGANLTGADLRGAKLRMVEVVGIKVKDAKFDEDTVLPDGWTKATALKRGMVFVSRFAAPTETSAPPTATGEDRGVKAVPTGEPKKAVDAPAHQTPRVEAR